jgi:putative transposase
MTLSMLEFENKQKFQLHAKGINHIVLKYYHSRASMWKSIKKKHKDSSRAKLPHNQKSYMPTGWDYQCINVQREKNIIKLAGIKDRGQITCHVKNIPTNVVEVELIYKDKYYLAIKYKEEIELPIRVSENQASIDLGEIHAITSIDQLGNALVITNRKIRSLIRLKDKRKSELLSLRSRCKEGSNRAKKYTKAIYKIRYESDRKINDAIHKMTRLYADWCIENGVSKVYYGDLDTVTRNAKGKLKKAINGKLNMWRFGEIIDKLSYKLNNLNIKLEKINEAYSSQTCPVCGKRNKVAKRNYACKNKKCGYKQHRDIVGAINILNWNTNGDLTRYIKKEYLQIV